MILEEEKESMIKPLDSDEVRNVVFYLNNESAPRLDSL